jgi:hypothetical protein
MKIGCSFLLAQLTTARRENISKRIFFVINVYVHLRGYMSCSFVVKYDFCILIKTIFMANSSIRAHEGFLTAVCKCTSTNPTNTDVKWRILVLRHFYSLFEYIYMVRSRTQATEFYIYIYIYIYNCGLSPRANYTHRATAACQRR